MKPKPQNATILYLDDIRATLLRNTITLEEHVKRTELLEKSVDKLVGEIIPLKTHVAMWGGAGKVITVVGSILAIALGVFKLIQLF